MMRRIAFVALSATSCVSSDAAFHDVRHAVHDRAALDVEWNRGGDDDDEAIRKKLEQPLTAQDAVQIALLNNRSLQAQLEDLGIARAVLLQGMRPSNPQFHGSLKFGEDERDLDITLVQSITDVVYAFSRASIARADLEATKLSLSQSVLAFSFATKREFYRYQAAEQILEMRRTIAESALAGYTLAKQMHEAGNMNDLDRDIERGLYEDARVQFARAEQALVEAREDLNKRMGLVGDRTTWTAVARLPDPSEAAIDDAGVEAEVVEKNFELAAIRHRLSAANGRIGLARAQGLFPNIGVGVAVEGEIGRDAPPLPVGPVVEVTLPLWDQGQGEIARRAAEQRRLEAQYVARAVDLRADARAVRTRAESLRQQADYLARVILPLRARILEKTQLMANAMQIGLFQLLMAKRDQIEAGRSYVETLARYWTARAELDLLLQGGSPMGGPAMDDMNDAAPAGRGGGH